jgi:hypothetical protein
MALEVLECGKTYKFDKGDESNNNLFTSSAPNYLPNNLLKSGHKTLNHHVYKEWYSTNFLIKLWNYSCVDDDPEKDLDIGG